MHLYGSSVLVYSPVLIAPTYEGMARMSSFCMIQNDLSQSSIATPLQLVLKSIALVYSFYFTKHGSNNTQNIHRRRSIVLSVYIYKPSRISLYFLFVLYIVKLSLFVGLRCTI